ncbi:uncharacterized protein J3R85_005117 [Psidium guajava]|nr:uncharacterized protein J3R85_005117 [Psidium guajava]
MYILHQPFQHEVAREFCRFYSLSLSLSLSAPPSPLRVCVCVCGIICSFLFLILFGAMLEISGTFKLVLGHSSELCFGLCLCLQCILQST